MVADPGNIDFQPELLENGRQLDSNDGAVTLQWPAPDGTIELQQASEPAFQHPLSRYTGSDPGSVITGLPEGQHYFRLRQVNTPAPSGPWSAPLEVRVEFMDRGHLILLLSLGAIVVLLTVGTIITGHYRTRREP